MKIPLPILVLAFVERGEFLCGKFKDGSRVPLGDHKRVSFGDGIRIKECQRRFCFEKNRSFGRSQNRHAG
jgi:hypothetical protein